MKEFLNNMHLSFQTHIDLVMDALTATIESLEDMEQLSGALNYIGKVHKNNCVNIQMIQVIDSDINTYLSK